MGVQFLIKGIEAGENGLLVLMGEEARHVKENMLNFGWDLDRLQQEGKLTIIEFGPSKLSQTSISGLANLIRIASFGVKRIVIDSITTLEYQVKDPFERRLAIMYLFETLSGTGSTSLVVAEMSYASPLARKYEELEFLAHGNILLHVIPLREEHVLALQITKMRGIEHDRELHPYKITPQGIVVYPDQRVFYYPATYTPPA